MKTITFFNNKGGVGKTSLVYHLSWMLAELEYRVIVADLDPQGNLSSMFLNENRLEELWKGKNGCTINRDIAPLFDGTGDINREPYIEKIGEGIGLLTGDLALSHREDQLSEEWPKCLDGKEQRPFRVMTAFSRLIDSAARSSGADIALIDVGPNLGAINRAALIATDHVVIPLAPDLFSLQGLKNVGPTLKDWRDGWRKRIEEKPAELDITMPSGKMTPVGYVIMRHSVRLSRPVQAYNRWIEKVPGTYKESIEITDKKSADEISKKYGLAHLKDYRSLMPIAQEARKPMFMLKPADGAIGAQQHAVTECYRDFKALAEKILTVCEIGIPNDDAQ